MQITTIKIAYLTYPIGKCFFSVSRVGGCGQSSHKDYRIEIDKTSPEDSLDVCSSIFKMCKHNALI